MLALFFLTSCFYWIFGDETDKSNERYPDKNEDSNESTTLIIFIIILGVITAIGAYFSRRRHRNLQRKAADAMADALEI
ncbi:uncharacterized protein MONOS_17283 [Monocercomonoides exilis]|uniref:uncharacterized protein n=1 Tax=Monocercomonoides exilis TaxID=2049356 RepID=UPI0035598E0E|nr:hypothetical protein MONOS_17283 [Monocercomonoides exilis]